MEDFIKRLFTWQWLQYHFTSLFEILTYTLPFRKKNQSAIIINPAGIIAFIAILICIKIYYEAAISLYYNLSFNGILDFLLLFGLNLFITFVLKKFCTFIKYDGFQLMLIQYSFFDKKETLFTNSQFSGLYISTENNNSTTNFKTCLAMKNGLNILLDISTKQDRAEKKLIEFIELFNVKKISAEGKTPPINNFWKGGTNADNSSF